ncbi:MAG TPA: DinB family protein [Bryobacteraceae bacterium]|jgi:hypothetical protein|nr:DinB family protein [Bryobacteraceae bacterium]
MHPSDPGLTREERAHVVRLLHDSENEFVALTAGLTHAQWNWQAAPGHWPVQHTAEHLVLGEAAMLARIEQALAAPPNADWEEHSARKSGFIARVLPDRHRKAAAPETLRPHGHWTCEETIARYKEGRARTLRFAEEVDRPLKAHSAEHPFPVFNMLNAYHWLLYIPLHNARHNRQIAEVLSAAASEAAKESVR